MSDGSKIEWLHDGAKKALTWNPTTGCTKLSDGCKHCYAKREWIRLSANPRSVYYGRKFEDVAMHPERLAVPLLMTKPRRIFVDSMSDIFHDKVADAFIDQIFAVMGLAVHHTFIVLTKRADRMRAYLSDPLRAHNVGVMQMLLAEKLSGSGVQALQYAGPAHLRLPLANVQLGVSVESRKHLDRVDELRATPAAVRVISAEPLLGDLGEFDLAGIHQVYAGGETGPKARPSLPNHFRSLRDQCARRGVAFFFKQWGDWGPVTYYAARGCQHPTLPTFMTDTFKVVALGDDRLITPLQLGRVGKKNAGRKLDGVEHSELVA